MKKIIFILISTLLLASCWEREHGEKVGTLVKLAKEGTFIPTYEAELIRGGMNSGNGAFGVQPFDFTIENPSLLVIAEKALKDQKEVRIKYHKEVATIGRTETTDNAFLDDIEIVN